MSSPCESNDVAVVEKMTTKIKTSTNMTKRALRALRHQERHAGRAQTAGNSSTSSNLPSSSPSSTPRRERGEAPRKSLVETGVVVEPTDSPAKGVFLISHPLSDVHAPGNIFHRSVVLLVHHDDAADQGWSYGLVVNKDKGQTLEEVLCEDALPLKSDALQRVLKNPVRVGGPVVSRLAWLHPHAEAGGLPLAKDAEKPVRTLERTIDLSFSESVHPTTSNLIGPSNFPA